MYLKKEIDKINAELSFAFAGFTYELSGLLFPRETSPAPERGAAKYLADPETDRKVSISDKPEISVLHVFGNEINYEQKERGGRGDGGIHTAEAEVTAVIYADPKLGNLFETVEATLELRIAGVSLRRASFSAEFIRENFLFLERDINHDRTLFAITYRIRVNTCKDKRGISRR